MLINENFKLYSNFVLFFLTTLFLTNWCTNCAFFDEHILKPCFGEVVIIIPPLHTSFFSLKILYLMYLENGTLHSEIFTYLCIPKDYEVLFMLFNNCKDTSLITNMCRFCSIGAPIDAAIHYFH